MFHWWSRHHTSRATLELCGVPLERDLVFATRPSLCSARHNVLLDTISAVSSSMWSRIFSTLSQQSLPQCGHGFWQWIFQWMHGGPSGQYGALHQSQPRTDDGSSHSRIFSQFSHRPATDFGLDCCHASATQSLRAGCQGWRYWEGDSSYSGPMPQSLGVCAAFFLRSRSIKLASSDVSDSISLSQAVHSPSSEKEKCNTCFEQFPVNYSEGDTGMGAECITSHYPKFNGSHFGLSNHLHPQNAQNDWAGWQFRVNYDACSHVPIFFFWQIFSALKTRR